MPGSRRGGANSLIRATQGLWEFSDLASFLGISEHTVRHHLEDIYRRLDVSSRAAAAQLATRALVGAGAVGV